MKRKMSRSIYRIRERDTPERVNDILEEIRNEIHTEFLQKKTAIIEIGEECETCEQMKE